jgi:hypothetical protein
MDITGYRINLDALLARVIFRWHWRVALGTLLLTGLFALAMGFIPPFWRGVATLTVDAAPGATVTVDGRPWPRAVYVGRHQVVARLPDGRISWADVELGASETLALTLPPGLPSPRMRVLPPSAPGFTIAHVWRAGDAWRVHSVPAPTSEPGAGEAVLATATTSPGQTNAITARGLERLSTIDAYGGLADEVHVGDRRLEAVFVPNARAAYDGRVAGAIEVRGWGAETLAVSVTHPLTLLRFSPDGGSLMLVEQTTTAGEQVSLIRRDGSQEPLVAVPGQVTRLSWRDDGAAVVLHSREADRLTLTLVRLAPATAVAVIGELDAAQHAGDLVPLTWDASSVLWIAPDDSGIAALWRAPLTRLIPERVQALDARALQWLTDGHLRVLVEQSSELVIGRYRGPLFIGEATLPQLARADDLVGIWHGDELLVQSAGRAWLVDLGGTPREEE